MVLKIVSGSMLAIMVIAEAEAVRHFVMAPTQPAPQIPLHDVALSSGPSISSTEATVVRVFAGYDIENQLELETERRKYMLVVKPFLRES